jgi:hypothetical protein
MSRSSERTQTPIRGFAFRRQDKCCLRLVELAGNALHRLIFERPSMWNHGKRVACQRPFREDIDKIKWDLH